MELLQENFFSISHGHYAPKGVTWAREMAANPLWGPSYVQACAVSARSNSKGRAGEKGLDSRG